MAPGAWLLLPFALAALTVQECAACPAYGSALTALPPTVRE